MSLGLPKHAIGYVNESDERATACLSGYAFGRKEDGARFTSAPTDAALGFAHGAAFTEKAPPPLPRARIDPETELLVSAAHDCLPFKTEKAEEAFVNLDKTAVRDRAQSHRHGRTEESPAEKLG
jgi:hypothetical protein